MMTSSISDGSFNLLFLGTGVSTSIPNLAHVVFCGNKRKSSEGKDISRSAKSNHSTFKGTGEDIDRLLCRVCEDAFYNYDGKNRRNNVSVAIIYNETATGNSISSNESTFTDNDETNIDRKQRVVVIDVGKTARDTFLRMFPRYGLQRIDSIILTHGHADAMFGLDDLRDIQSCEKVDVHMEDGSLAVGFKILSEPLQVFLNQETKLVADSCFGYLTMKPEFLDEANLILKRRVALLDFQVIENTAELNLYGLPVRSFPVYHGGDYISLGFSIGKAGELVYISDVKIVPPNTMTYLKSIGQIKVLVLDALDVTDGVWSHMSLAEALEFARELRPDTVYFVGMGCSFGMHDDMEAELAAKYPFRDKGGREKWECHLAYDGLLLEGFKIR